MIATERGQLSVGKLLYSGRRVTFYDGKAGAVVRKLNLTKFVKVWYYLKNVQMVTFFVGHRYRHTRQLPRSTVLELFLIRRR